MQSFDSSGLSYLYDRCLNLYYLNIPGKEYGVTFCKQYERVILDITDLLGTNRS